MARSIPKRVRLRTWREGEGLSQKDLAKKVGVSRQSVNSWETGHSIPEAIHWFMLDRITGGAIQWWVWCPSRVLRRAIEEAVLGPKCPPPSNDNNAAPTAAPSTAPEELVPTEQPVAVQPAIQP